MIWLLLFFVYVKAFFLKLTWVCYVTFAVIRTLGFNKANMLLIPNTSCKIFLVNGSKFANILF